MSETRTAGAIYDLGYQRYEGALLGRWYSFTTLIAYSFRAAFGLGRGDKARTLPMLVLTLVYIPALLQVGVASASGMTQFIHYADYLQFTAFLLALYTAGMAPELVVADKQLGLLSLYLSRPMRSTDYAWAKLIALTMALLVLTLGPQLMLFVGRVLIAKEPWPVLVTEWPKLFPILGGSLLISLFIAAIGLSLSSLASTRGYAGAAVISFFLFSAALAEIVREIGFGGMERYAVLGNPALLIAGFAGWLFEIEARRRGAVGRAALPGEYYLYVMVAVTLLGIALFIYRYRKVDV